MTVRHTPTLIVIAGPTAVGKTDFAVSLAERLGTVILSADSRQFYKEMEIGTAKPSKEDRARVPHYFVGHLSIHDSYNVSRYESDVLKLLPQIFEEMQSVLMAGGSGLYIDAVCNGIDEFPDPDPELRKYLKGVLANEGVGKLREMLLHHDAEYYHQVDRSNPVRLMRALEVCLETGKPYSVQRLKTRRERGFRTIKIGLTIPRQELFARINNRVDLMLEKGLEEEARQLYPFHHLNALNTVGYKELFGYFDGFISREQAIEDIKTHTRRYAKRQLTWFCRDKEMQWFFPSQMDEVLQLIKSAEHV